MNNFNLKEIVDNLNEEELKLCFKDIKEFNENNSLSENAFLRKLIDTDSPYFLINVVTISNLILFRIAEMYYKEK